MFVFFTKHYLFLSIYNQYYHGFSKLNTAFFGKFVTLELNTSVSSLKH